MLVFGLSCLLTLFLRARAALVEVVVDDTQGDPVTGAQVQYTANSWDDGPCQTCYAKPDPNSAYKGTWHDGTGNYNGKGPITASFVFKGTKISVQIIRVGSELSKAGVGGLDADYYFFIDGNLVSTLVQPAPSLGGDGFGYGYTVYSNDSLPNASHQITVQAGRASGPQTLLLLDSFKYSYDDGSSSSSSSSQSSDPTASSDPSGNTTHPKSSHTAVIASVTSVVSALALGLAVFLFIYCRRKRRSTDSNPKMLHTDAAPTHITKPMHSGVPELYNDHAPTNATRPNAISITSRPTAFSGATPYSGTTPQSMPAAFPYPTVTPYPVTHSPDHVGRNAGSFTFTDNKGPFATPSQAPARSTTSFDGHPGSAIGVDYRRSNPASDVLSNAEALPPAYADQAGVRKR